jgi:hypothetical protein
VNLVHNAPRLFVTRSGVQADQVRRAEWGREMSVTNRPGPALSNFDRPGPTWGVGEGVHSDEARRSGRLGPT